MYSPLIPAPLAFNDAGIPWSPTFDDIYHSDSGGLAQAQHVFIGGNDLPAAWQAREQFVILETGFGLGLNFLATWQAWRNDPGKRYHRLHFVSVEKHPFHRNDLQRLHGQWPQLGTLASELQSQWPPLTPGVHRILLDDGRVTLTLLFGDALTQLRKLSLQADALYLDGFAPSRNPDMWSGPFLKSVTRLCKPGATLATWTVAASVREALTAQRWQLEKRPGFGSKRDMLCGRLSVSCRNTVRAEPVEAPTAPGTRPSTSSGRTAIKQHAIVIGAGIAGTGIAERLAARGWRIDLIERHATPANEASGNPVGLLHPMLAKDDNLAARLSRAGYLYSLRLLAQLDREPLGLHWQQCGVLQLARDMAQEEEQRETNAALQFPHDYVRFLDRDEAIESQSLQHGIIAGGWHYPTGAIVNPPSLCAALLRRHGSAITTHYRREVARLRHDGDCWHALDRDGHVLASAPTVIVANAHDALRLLPQCALPITRLRGQISVLPHGALPALRHALCGNGYVTPQAFGPCCVGATFDMDDDDPNPRAEGHRFNLERLAELMPGVDLTPFDSARLQGRVGFRTMAIDRMPVVGAVPGLLGESDTKTPMTARALKPGAQLRDVPRLPGLYALTALGSRGLAWGPLAAELLAAQISGEPLPLERDLIDAIDPARFLIREQRRDIGNTAIVANAQDL